MGYLRKGPEQYMIEGNNKLLLGEYKAAILEFTKAIIEDPYMPQPYTCRASAKLELRDYKGAIADCQEALRLHYRSELRTANPGKSREINPIYGKIYSIIGICKLLLGNVEDGFVDLNSSRLFGYTDAIDIINAYTR